MYKIIGTYKGRSEVIDTAETKKEALIYAQEYKMAYGSDWSITTKNSLIYESGQ